MSGDAIRLDDKLDGLRAHVVAVIREQTGLKDEFALPIAARIIDVFRREVAGERVYVPVRDPDIAKKVAAEFDGNNRDALLAKYDIDRSTFYRYLQRARDAAPRRAPRTPDDTFTL